MSAQQAPKSEFVVKVPRKHELKRYSVLKFNSMDKVDTSKWSAESMLTLEREDNKGVMLSSQSIQEYGEGSEYGKAAREEARRKKYGRQARSYRLDNQPWLLTFNEPDGRERKMRSIREGGAGEHADYWVFLKMGEEFHAYKVDDWHKFLPAITHKTLDIDQAEEKFLQRNKVMNQFALKAQIQSQLKNGDEDNEQIDSKATRSLKIKDEHSSDDSDADDERNDDNEKPKNKKDNKKKKANDRPKKDKRQRVENGDEVARYESSDGEDEGREYDYMSDSGSDSGREDVQADENIEKQLVGVGDETGLKKMIDSDEETDSDEEDITKKLLNRDDDGKKKDHIDIEERDSSGSDTDDPDKDKIDSVVFMPKKEGISETTSSSSKKRPADLDTNGSEPKKAKVEPSIPEGLNEETVRKYLRRKPHTTKELLTKIMQKCSDMTKAEVVTKLAAILKAIEPHQFKQKQGKKEVLFFSLTNSLA